MTKPPRLGRVVFIRQHLSLHGSSRPWEQIKGLTRAGYAVTVVCGLPGGAPTIPLARFSTLGVQYSQHQTFARRKRSFLAFVVKAIPIAVWGRREVTFVSSTPLTVFIPGVLAKLAHPRSRLVIEVRDLWPDIPRAMGALSGLEYRAAQVLAWISYRLADHIIALSPGMESALKARTRTPVTTVTNGASRLEMMVSPSASSGLRARLGIPPAARVVLYSGTIGRVNDPTYLADLVTGLLAASTDAYFVHVGGGTHVDEVRQRLLGLPRAVFVGRVPREHVGGFLSIASLSLVTTVDLPLLETNSANKFFDALVAGCPVAINYGGWQEDLLSRTGAGFRLSRDIPQAVHQITDYLGDPEEHLRMRLAAEQAGRDFDWDLLFTRWKAALLGHPS